MIVLRKAEDRGQANHGWLQTAHTFSFANYYDPNYLGFKSLRVINEDHVAPEGGFSTHGHQDMEILTYVLEGALEHKDSLGNGSMIQPGEIQRMSAGTGIFHSEFNPSHSDPVHLLQIWILPAQKGLDPSYQQQQLDFNSSSGKLHLIASSEEKEGTVTVHQDVKVYAGKLPAGDRLVYDLASHRYAWIQVARGSILLNGMPLEAGDGAAVSQETQLKIEATQAAEILLFDLA